MKNEKILSSVKMDCAVDEGKNKGVIHSETLFNKNDIKFLLLKKAGKYYKSYFEAEKHLKQDYEYLTGE